MFFRKVNLKLKKSSLAIIFFLLSFFCFAKGITDIKKEGGENTFSCSYKNTVRKYSLWLPETETPEGLILMLHGYGETITSFKSRTKMNDYALPSGYAVCYVSSGNEPGWNSGSGVSKKDDYGFLCALNTYLCEAYSILVSGTYLCGFSNGAFMCHYAALQKKTPFAGIIAVSGLAPLNVWEKNKANCKLDLFQVYGTKDDLVLSKKNAKENVSRGYPYIEDVTEQWIKVNSLEFEEDFMPGETSFLKAYTGLKNKMWILQVKDYPHQWPASRTTGYELSALIIDFLESGK